MGLLGVLLPAVVSLTGCAPPPASVGPASPSSTAATTPSATAVASTGSSAADSAAPSAGSAGAAGLVVDARLLQALPVQVDGVVLEPDSTTAARIADDPTLAGSAQAIAVALAISPGTSSSGDDLAIVSVIRLRPGVFSDAWYATWRSTYDTGACEVAGGVEGSPAQVSIAGRTVYEGSCAGDATTYHVHLSDPALIVSITAAGARHFGELVVAGLVG